MLVYKKGGTNMAKFVIECPHCHSYAQVKSGFFHKNRIKCLCGEKINLKTDKMTSRDCPHCGNNVVYDQSLKSKANCPVCKNAINTLEEQRANENFSCQQCGIRLSTSKSATTYTCPVCDFENRVQERLASEKIKRDGLASIIKYEGDNKTLIWKHPIEDFNLGSQLIVHESQEAVFFKDGQALDTFGAGRYTLETQQLPMIEKMYGTLTDNEGTFHSEVYYINLTTQMGIKWGTDSKVRLFDPTSGLHLELGAGGEFNLRIIHGRKLLLKILGTGSKLQQSDILGMDGGQNFFRTMIITQVKTYLAQAIKELSLNILEIDAHLLSLSQELKSKINVALDSYGIELPEFFISRIVTPDDDPNFAMMKEQYAQQYLLVRQEEIKKQEALAAAERKAVEAETEARMKIISAQGDAEAYRLQAQAEAQEMQMKGYTYQQETARQVGLEAMQNGIGGSGGGGMLGDMAALGINLGAMGSVMGMTKDVMSPVLEGITPQATPTTPVPPTTQPTNNTWTCTCGQTENHGNFCLNCGEKKPVEGWNCSCGETGIKGNFCSNCGNKKPDEGWTCTCGETGVKGNFCSNCGKGKEG